MKSILWHLQAAAASIGQAGSKPDPAGKAADATASALYTIGTGKRGRAVKKRIYQPFHMQPQQPTVGHF